MNNSDLIHTALNRIREEPGKEVFPFHHNGTKFWLKRTRPTGSNILHRSAWSLSRFPLLVPVETNNPGRALKLEAKKLSRLERNGLPVPRIVESTDSFLILEDRGVNTRTALRSGLVTQEEIFPEILRLLAKLHRTGEYHGASQIRNFVYRDGEISILDFEESFSGKIPLESLQRRDLFLLFFSMVKDGYTSPLSLLLREYELAGGIPHAEESLKALALKLRPFFFPLRWKRFRTLFDKDSQAAYRLIEELSEL
jgi:hypothetical protein